MSGPWWLAAALFTTGLTAFVLAIDTTARRIATAAALLVAAPWAAAAMFLLTAHHLYAELLEGLAK